MNSPNEEPAPSEKKLRVGSFVVHSARGVIRDRKVRRWAMFVILIVALVMLFLGSTWLATVIDPGTRPGWYLFYWMVCAWLTFTAVLLAIFDLLMVRAEARGAKRRLRRELDEAEEET